ncbi:hypothetical protein A1O1_03994 [Capronia coronata CBS 617.96]|uniref:Alcohol dehydrogenase n=1 Tax=Capronia coronata CBS 617.96 TaxID=1182541 RepID=W9YEF5_9EURO|nr:uncharacterized protein A1O1_03994 [Capronia coronata CBS 617.96]EXJ90888.1 hypothetical protein A1O1_03994 [Capronia coronata CBS 617.96]
MGAVFTQLYPPRPTFTEKDVPSLVGKVFIVTGGNAGVGLELVKMLYLKGGTVYIAGRSASRIAAEIEAMSAIPTDTPGKLKSLIVDLNDLSTVSPCVSEFLAQESRLDVLWNNAGVAQPPTGAGTSDGIEAIMRINCLGAFLLTKMLLPVLIKTAQSSPGGSVRIVFTSSGIIDMSGPPGGIDLAELVPGNYSKDASRNYSASKAGNWFLASEFDKRIREHGIVSVAQSPGTLRTKGWDRAPWSIKVSMALFMHEPKMGALTELWAGLSPDVKLEDGGRFAIPWGRWHPSPNKEILQSLKTKEEGGTGLAAQFWQWCEEHTKQYANL